MGTNYKTFCKHTHSYIYRLIDIHIHTYIHTYTYTYDELVCYISANVTEKLITHLCIRYVTAAAAALYVCMYDVCMFICI